MSHRLASLLTYTTLAVLFLVGIGYLVWTFQPTKILDVRNSPVPVRPKEINPEATVIISPILCKSVQASAVVRRTLVSATAKVLLPDYANQLPKGCSSLELAVIIPGQTPDGLYHLEYDVTYQLWLKVSVAHWESQEFTVHHVPPLAGDSGGLMIQSSTGSTTTTNTTNNNTTNNTTNNVPVPVPVPAGPGVVERVLTTIGNLLPFGH